MHTKKYNDFYMIIYIVCTILKVRLFKHMVPKYIFCTFRTKVFVF